MLNLSLYIFCFTVIPQSFFPPEAYIIALIFINFKRANITQKLKTTCTSVRRTRYNTSKNKATTSWRCGNASGAQSIKRDPELSRLIENRKRPCDGLITMTEDQILTAVLNDQLFGALEVDLHVPDVCGDVTHI